MRISAQTLIKSIFAKFSQQHGINSLSMVNGQEIPLVVHIQLMLRIMKKIKIQVHKTILMKDGLTIHNSESL
jgi:hypothetical protein